MKTFLIIGMGRFGHYLCSKLIDLKNEVMIVDENEENIDDMLSVATSAKIGDCTNPEVLASLGIGNFDICFVCIGDNFQSSLEITSQLKEMGAKYVISKANRDLQAKFLLRNGADEVIYPDRDIAEKTAAKCSANNVFDYIEITDEYSIYEIVTPPEWVGQTIREVNCRATYNINILGTKKGSKTHVLPSAEHIFKEAEHLMIIGTAEDVDRLLKVMKNQN